MYGVELYFERKLSRFSKHLRDWLVDRLEMVKPTLN